MPTGIYKHKNNQGFQKGHSLMGINSTSKGKNWKLKQETKDKMSKSKTGNKSCLGKQNALGSKHTDEVKLKKREAVLGDKNPNWKGGFTNIDKLCRRLPIYIQWRSDCFTRDNWKCRTCGFIGYLTVHHIKSFSKIIKENNILNTNMALECKELWDLENGITLCEICHSLTDNYKAKAKKQ